MASEAHDRQEQKAAEEKIALQNKAIADTTFYYAARAEMYSIANFVPERLSDNGRIINREESITWPPGGILAISPNSKDPFMGKHDPKKVIEFIDNSEGMRNGDIKKCTTQQEAQQFRNHWIMIKRGQNEFSATGEEKQVIEVVERNSDLAFKTKVVADTAVVEG